MNTLKGRYLRMKGDPTQFTKDQLINVLQKLECPGNTPVFLGDPEVSLHHVVESPHDSLGNKRTVVVLRN